MCGTVGYEWRPRGGLQSCFTACGGTGVCGNAMVDESHHMYILCSSPYPLSLALLPSVTPKLASQTLKCYFVITTYTCSVVYVQCIHLELYINFTLIYIHAAKSRLSIYMCKIQHNMYMYMYTIFACIYMYMYICSIWCHRPVIH